MTPEQVKALPYPDVALYYNLLEAAKRIPQGKFSGTAWSRRLGGKLDEWLITHIWKGKTFEGHRVINHVHRMRMFEGDVSLDERMGEVLIFYPELDITDHLRPMDSDGNMWLGRLFMDTYKSDIWFILQREWK